MPRLMSRMTARDTAESHRASSPLELLFDLTFVAAIAQIALQFAHKTAEGHALEYLVPFLMVFFAIWWAWMNLTWFASAYDTDDIAYRLLVFVQMGGVLVIAAGVPMAFDDDGFLAVTIGYAIMRVAMLALWIRAGLQHPAGRVTAFRYAAAIGVVQVLWIARVVLGLDSPWVFLALAVLEVSIPAFAERTGTTSWHPHHIAERYGLFTIILLGESVLAATTGVQTALESGLSAELIVIAIGGLAIIFTLWWLYFAEPAGEGLERHRERSFVWGFSHFFAFAALAALGSGLEVAVETAGHPEPGHEAGLGPVAVLYAVAVPVALFLTALWAAHAPIVDRAQISPLAIAMTVVAVLLIPLSATLVGVGGAVVLLALVLAALLALTLVDSARRERRSAVTARPNEGETPR
jgi:low temperature requirement protein LtrA